MIATLNGKTVLEAVASLPVVGAWTADLEVDAETVDGLSGPASLVLGSLTLAGAPIRLGSFAGRTSVRLVGGAGGLGRTLEPKGYRNATLLLVLQDIARDAGEVLAPTTDTAALASIARGWTRARESAGLALARVAAAAGLAWRVLPDGTVQVANETWAATLLADGVLLDESPELGRSVFGVDSPSLLPGVTVGGRRVSRVEHCVGPNALRTRVWWES